MATAYVWSGQWADYKRLVPRLENAPSPTNDRIGQFFLGQSLMWSNPNRAVQLLGEVRTDSFGKSSGVVSMIYAEALGHAAWHNNSMSQSEESIKEASRATMILQHNPVPIVISNWAHLVAVQIRKAADKPFGDLLDATKGNVETIAHYEEYDIGYPCRAWYFDAAEDNEAAIDLLEHCVVVRKRSGWIASMLAAEMYRFGRSKEGLELLNQIDRANRDAIVDTARAFLIWDVEQSGGSAEIKRILALYADRVQSDEQAAWAVMMIRLFTGDLEAARKLSMQLRMSSSPRIPEAFDFISGASTARQVLDGLKGQRMNECLARFLIGLYLLADDKPVSHQEARSILQPAVKAGGLMIDPQTHWIRAVYEREFGPRSQVGPGS